MKIAFLVFDGITALDAIGPYEVLSRLPGAQALFVGETQGIKRTENKFLGINADHALAGVPAADILVIPGGPGTLGPINSPSVLEWIRQVDRGSQWTTSACTGSLILGAAGLLKGLRATSHWASLDRLSQYGAEPTLERVVRQGKIITAAGVSSGIDMGLILAEIVAGREAAQMIQLDIEYDPQPPFDCGSPLKAPQAIVEEVRRRIAMRRAAEAR